MAKKNKADRRSEKAPAKTEPRPAVHTAKALDFLLDGYLLFLGLALPLYLPDGYQALGYDKFVFWRNGTMVFLILAAVLYLSLLFQKTPDLTMTEPWKQPFSGLDKAMLAYGLVITVSFLFAHDHEEALWGTYGWHLGWMTHLLVLAVYALYSRMYRRHAFTELFLVSGFLPVMILQFFQRLGLFTFDNALNEQVCVSTVGNINWYCGYQAVMVSVLTARFVKEDPGKRTWLFLEGLFCLFALFSLITNGSNSVYLYLLSVFTALFILGLTDMRILKRMLVLAGESGMLAWIMNLLRLARPDLYLRLIAYEDNYIGLIARNHIGLILALGCAALLWLLRKRGENGKEVLTVKRAGLLLGGILLGGVMLVLLVQFTGIPYLADSWGNNRGALWRFSKSMFLAFPWFRKGIGTGPDCYFIWYFDHQEYAAFVDQLAEGWRYTNAHSEGLTILINTGIFGLISTLAVFVLAFLHGLSSLAEESGGRGDQGLITVLVITGVSAVLTVSFQHIMLLPYLFLIFALEQSGKSTGLSFDETGNS